MPSGPVEVRVRFFQPLHWVAYAVLTSLAPFVDDPEELGARAAEVVVRFTWVKVGAQPWQRMGFDDA